MLLHLCCGHICFGLYAIRNLHRRTDNWVLMQAYKDLTEVMANQQDLVDIEHRLLPMLNVKVRPGFACTVADCHSPFPD